jgi:predicted O-methyltransferase YrrM
MTRLRAVLTRWTERLGIWPFRWLALAGLWLLRRQYGDDPVPLATVLRVRRLAAGRQPLVPPTRPRAPREVADPGLRELLAGRELGVWALGPEAIERLARTFRTLRPAHVIEFGSGVSTLCLAFLAREQGGAEPPVIVSFDQEAAHAGATEDWLERAGLDAFATVHHAPLAPIDWEGRSVSTYQLPAGWEGAHDRQAGLVMVDGPAAEDGARYATLPLVRGMLAPGAVVVLDDALRDGELDVARRWLAEGWIVSPGIVLTDKGLLVGGVPG